MSIPYQVVEVNPLTKKEIKVFTDYRKLPVVRLNDEVVVDSSRIISRLRELGMTPERRKELTEDAFKEEQTWRQWVNQQLIVLASPNTYRTLPEALEALTIA
ncbi:hypothetical protein PsorP6_003531 [Peronosclerospora sorghi]|uniref:Uncharacterized protein n=1 Tax=Peronosclerospora sorghi TaxID=230839 RepID=A0ACC0VNN3_9STRA|nr:hypothetical protein PsorP6_003531 [Peronosclerospora sorghi]